MTSFDIPDLPDPPEWLPLERYGIGVPFLLAGGGLYLLVYAAPGVSGFSDLSVYSKVGVVTISVFGIAFVIASGYTYSVIDTTWWKKTEEEDAEGVIDDGEE